MVRKSDAVFVEARVNAQRISDVRKAPVANDSEGRRQHGRAAHGYRHTLQLKLR